MVILMISLIIQYPFISLINLKEKLGKCFIYTFLTTFMQLFSIIFTKLSRL